VRHRVIVTTDWSWTIGTYMISIEARVFRWPWKTFQSLQLFETYANPIIVEISFWLFYQRTFHWRPRVVTCASVYDIADGQRHCVLSNSVTTYDLELLLNVTSYFKPVNSQNLEICYIGYRLLNYFRAIKSYVCPIPTNVSLHSKYFKVVQGHVLLVHQRTCVPLTIADFFEN